MFSPSLWITNTAINWARYAAVLPSIVLFESNTTHIDTQTHTDYVNSSESATERPPQKDHHRKTTHSCTSKVVIWCSGGMLVSMNEVNLRQAWLVLGWVTVSRFNFRCGTFISVCNQPPRSTQPGHPFVGRRNDRRQRRATWQPLSDRYRLAAQQMQCQATIALCFASCDCGL